MKISIEIDGFENDAQEIPKIKYSYEVYSSKQSGEKPVDASTLISFMRVIEWLRNHLINDANMK